jgi:mono/diheme cytochrome c family protein
LVLLAAVTIAVGLRVDGIRWRAVVIVKKVLGQIDGLSWGELLSRMAPDSGLKFLLLHRTGNAYSSIVNLHTTPEDRTRGARLFELQCVECHGPEGTAGAAPPLVGRDLEAGDSDWSLFQTITKGRPELGMAAVPVTEEEAWQIVGHVRALRVGLQPAVLQGRRIAVDVPAARLENAAALPENWLTYSGSYDSRRYSLLDQVTRENVAELKLAWTVQLPSVAVLDRRVFSTLFASDPGQALSRTTFAALAARSWSPSPCHRAGS